MGAQLRAKSPAQKLNFGKGEQNIYDKVNIEVS